MYRLVSLAILALSFPLYAQADEPGASAGSENATLYILRPNLPGKGFSTFSIYGNGELLAEINERQGFKVEATPGKHKFRIEQSSKYKAYDGLQSSFDLHIAAGVTAIVRCDDHVGQHNDPDEQEIFLATLDDCSTGVPYSKATKGGVTYCGKLTKPFLKKSWAAKYHTYGDQPNCQLIHDTELIDKAKMVVALHTVISNDGEAEFRLAREQNTPDSFEAFMQSFPESRYLAEAQGRYDVLLEAEFAKAQQAGSADAMRAFVSSYPNSRYVATAQIRLAELEAEQMAAARERKMRERLDRDSMLSPQARKDKYTVILTNHLKKQQFEEALFYFNLLEYMNAAVSPSFDFFWGEALLRTGQLPEAQRRLYSYINENGSSGKYYTRALELTAEAEGSLAP